MITKNITTMSVSTVVFTTDFTTENFGDMMGILPLDSHYLPIQRRSELAQG